MFRVQTEANRSDDCQWTKEVVFDKGYYIVREGDMGDLFYIIEEGHVECLKRCYIGPHTYEEKIIRKLTSGDHFGELALINEDKRTISVRVGSDRVKLLALDRGAFNRILG